jgi:hypothetical protein
VVGVYLRGVLGTLLTILNVKELMGLPLINEINIDDSGIKVNKGNLVYVDNNGNETTYSVNVSSILSSGQLYIIDFNIYENSFTYLKDGEKKTEKIKDEKIRNIIQNMSDGVDSFVINSILYDIIFKKVILLYLIKLLLCHLFFYHLLLFLSLFCFLLLVRVFLLFLVS